MRLDVGIVGAGTAGAAAALLLARQGHAVTLYEQVPEPSPIGAGIMMQPSGLAVLARLGLVDAIVRRGSQVTRLHCETSSGRPILDLAYGDLDPEWYGLGLHRGVLFQELHRAVRGEAITLRTGVGIAGLRRDGAGVHVEDDHGAEHGPHDLLVVADGARSRLRDATSLGKVVRPYTWGALWIVAEDPGHAFADELHQVVEGPTRMLGFLPTGLGPRGETPLVSLFWSVRADRIDALRAGGLSAFRDEVLRVSPRAEPLLDQIDDFEALTFASYFDVVMDRWATRDIVYLGDAAHAMSPQLGQGCNLALCDAAALADALAEEPHHVPSALDRYVRARREHLAYYQFATRWLTPFFQSDWDALALFRDYVMGPAASIPFVRREMVRSMCGTKAGLLFGSLDVPRAFAPARKGSLRPTAALSSKGS